MKNLRDDLIENVKKDKKAYILSLIALITSMVVGTVFFGTKTYAEITKDSKRIEIRVETKKNRKGFLVLNDSLTIFGGIKQTANSVEKNNHPNLELEDISAPYLLLKESDEKHLKLMKNYETYFFNLDYD